MVELRLRAVIQKDGFVTARKLEEYYDMVNRTGRAEEIAARNKLITPEESPEKARPVIATIRVPTLIVWGLDNPAFSPGAADDILDLLPASVFKKKTVYDNVGHKVELEEPVLLAHDIGHFLDEAGYSKPFLERRRADHPYNGW